MNPCQYCGEQTSSMNAVCNDCHPKWSKNLGKISSSKYKFKKKVDIFNLANRKIKLKDDLEALKSKCWEAKICHVCGEEIKLCEIINEKKSFWTAWQTYEKGRIFKCQNNHETYRSTTIYLCDY